MPRFYTHYWKNETCNDYRSRELEGTPVRWATSGLFRPRGVTRGDLVYAITVYDGQLYLIGRITVAEVISRDEALKRFMNDVYDADTVVVADSNRLTPMRLRQCVPLTITERLEFHTPSGTVRLTFDAPGHLDQQTLRGVRELTSYSAQLLDEIIEQTK